MLLFIFLEAIYSLPSSILTNLHSLTYFQCSIVGKSLNVFGFANGCSILFFHYVLMCKYKHVLINTDL